MTFFAEVSNIILKPRKNRDLNKIPFSFQLFLLEWFELNNDLLYMFFQITPFLRLFHSKIFADVSREKVEMTEKCGTQMLVVFGIEIWKKCEVWKKYEICYKGPIYLAESKNECHIIEGVLIYNRLLKINVIMH